MEVLLVTCDRCGAEVPREGRISLCATWREGGEVYDVSRMDLCAACARALRDVLGEGDPTAAQGRLATASQEVER